MSHFFELNVFFCLNVLLYSHYNFIEKSPSHVIVITSIQLLPNNFFSTLQESTTLNCIRYLIFVYCYNNKMTLSNIAHLEEVGFLS